MRRAVIQTAIILFCVWHMAAVLIFSTPRIAKDSFAVAANTYLIPIVAPYLQITSQWQLWDLFAPDPLRRITSYRIERQVGDEWQTLQDIETGTYPWYEHSTRFKYYVNVLDDTNDNKNALKRQFLSLQCREHAIAENARIRLTYRTWIIPYLTSIPAAGFWGNWAPNVEEKIGPDILCPPLAS